MKHLGIPLAVTLALSAGAASAQVDDGRYGPAPYGDYSHRTLQAYDDGDVPYRDADRSDAQVHYDWARVLRVDPVFDGRSRPVHDARRCRARRDGYASRDPYRDHGDDRGYGAYGGDYRDPYRDPYRRDDRQYDPYGQARRDENGRMVATVLGGIAGAVLGSKIGDGSGRYVGTAVGSMVGGVAGREIYDASRRGRDGYVTVCEPEPYPGDSRYGGYASGERAVTEYEVTYEYAGREYVTRTDHHPGDRIRVRVDVRAQ